MLTTLLDYANLIKATVGICDFCELIAKWHKKRVIYGMFTAGELSMHEAYLISLLLAIASNSVLIFILQTRAQRVIAIVSFILFLVCINVWAIPFFVINAFNVNETQFMMLSKLGSLGYIFIPVTFLVFSLAFTVHFRVMQSFLFWFLLLAPALTFLFFSWTTELVGIHDMKLMIRYEWGVETPAGKFFPTFLFWFDGIMLIALWLIIHTYRTTEDLIRKRQSFFVLIAIIIPLVIGTVTNGVMPVLGTHVFPAAIPLTSITAIIIVVAIFRYGLFEVGPFNILSSLDHGMLTVDNKGKILQLNAVAERMVGVRGKNAIGKKVETVLRLVDGKGKAINLLQRFVLPALEKGKKNISDVFFGGNKRSKLPFLMTVSPIYSKQSIIGGSIIFRDISKERVREKHKDDFISMISHELKTPITSIKGYNQLLLRQLDSGQKKQRHIVVRVDQELDRLNRLIKNFLDLSGVQSGKLKIEKEIFQIEELIHEIVEAMKMAYRDRQMHVQIKNTAFVYADRDKVAQVLTNLITNAFKYSPKDKRVVISTSVDRKFVTVHVKDYGQGIPEEHHKKIFAQFYQLNRGGNGRDGLGIGLYIASNIVRAHGGKIWLTSGNKTGTTFYFSLPLA